MKTIALQTEWRKSDQTMTRYLLSTLLLSLSQAQFSPFNSFPGPVQFSSFSSSFANPGQLEFSNFVDLPSQRLRQPANQPGSDSLPPDCALPLNTGGCISYQDVNAAFAQAAESLPFQPLKFPNIGNFSNEEIGNLGTIIHEATRILAKVIKVGINFTRTEDTLTCSNNGQAIARDFSQLQARRFLHCSK